MANFLDQLLGLGYAGYAEVNGVALPILPSQAVENDNLIPSRGAYTTSAGAASGPLPSRQRPSLNIQVATPLSPASVPLIKALGYEWRAAALIDTVPEVPLKLVLANEEGYEGTGYIDGLAVVVQADQLPLLTIAATLWVWTNKAATGPTARVRKALNPLDPAHRPLAPWQTVPRFTGISPDSVPLAWSLQFAHNWTYQSFLGGYLQPPNPSLIYPGPLDCQLAMTWLARPNDRPRSTGTATIQLGTDPVLSTIHVPGLVRSPGRSPQGLGSQNEPIRWQANYYVSNASPY